MATRIYNTAIVHLLDDTKLYLTPLKIRYLREFMDEFENVRSSQQDSDAISYLSRCVVIAMQQYCPSIKTVEQLEDVANLPIIYKILEIAADIKINETSEEPVKQQAVESGSTWDTLNLAKIESEVFLMGTWKDYEDLELSLSMPELTETLNAKREHDYDHRKFLAAIQGIDMEANQKSNAWEDLKARVFSGGKAKDGNDILAFQGVNAQKAGFGIGMGLGYTKVTE